jgi:prevent-host-death family protein
MLYSVYMNTVVGVAEARAQLSEIIAQAVHRGTVTVIERYGKPAVAVVPVEALESMRVRDDATGGEPVGRPTSLLTPRERHARLVDALDRLRDVVEMQTPEESEATFETFNSAYRESRGRDIER